MRLLPALSSDWRKRSSARFRNMLLGFASNLLPISANCARKRFLGLLQLGDAIIERLSALPARSNAATFEGSYFAFDTQLATSCA